MKILIFTNDYKPMVGGVSNVEYELAQNFHRLGHEVTILTKRMIGDESFDMQQAFKTIRIPNIWYISYLIDFIYLLIVIKRYKVDVVRAGMWRPCGLLCGIVNKLTGIPYVVAMNGIEVIDSTVSFKKRLKKFIHLPLRKFTINNSILCIVISRFTKNKILETIATNKEIEIINCGTDPAVFKPFHVDSSSVIPFDDIEGRKIILTVARLYDYKGVDMVIRALPQILESVPDAIYLVVGEGPYLPVLEELVSERDLQKVVYFTGGILDADVVALYNLCNVFVMATRAIMERPNVEGFGIVFLEANACGKPVVGGNSGGIPDAVLDGETGLLVDPEDPEAIAKALIKLLSDEEYAMQLGENGRRRVVEELNWEQVARLTIKKIANRLSRSIEE